jgi:phage replication initiation protein
MRTKVQYPHADHHMLERARLIGEDFAKINESIREALVYRPEPAAARSDSSAAQALPPTSNTGGKKIQLVVEGGKTKEVIARTHSENSVCFIDWVNVTCHETSFQWGEQPVSDDQVIADCSLVCESLFGFGITSKRDRGANFYRTSFVLGDNYGLVCYGGQRNTVLIMLNGEGCAASRLGWERRLFDFLQSATQPKITRLDLAHDDIEGKTFTPESLEKAYDDGKFNNGGRNPDIELRGNWKNPTGKGRTVNIGRRTNGRFFRGYEKGKQLGDATSPWMRLEVEFKSVDRVIPFEALLRPQDYYAAAYPLLSDFSNRAERILTIQKTVEVSYERTKRWLKHQCGSALNLMLQLEGTADKVLELVMREGKAPKGVTVPSYLNSRAFFHNQPKPEFYWASIYESFAGET